MEKKQENQLRFLVGFGLLAAPLLGLFWPEPLEPQIASRLLPAILHSLTLGVFVPLFVVRLYQEPVGWLKLSPWVVGLLGLGLLGFLVGFLTGNDWFFYLGGHYGVPGALYLLSFQAARGAWVHRKQGGLHQLGWISLGLFVVVNLGGMLVLDRFYGGKYGFFSPNTVLSHGLGALMLFLLPFLWEHAAAKAPGWIAFGLGVLGLGGFLFGWVADQPMGLGFTGLVAAGFLIRVGCLLPPKRYGWGIKTGWFVAALGATGPLLFVVLPFDLPRLALGWGLFFLFGLAVPLLVDRCGLGFQVGEAFYLTQLGLASLLASLYVSGQPTRWVFALFALSWALRFWKKQPRPPSSP